MIICKYRNGVTTTEDGVESVTVIYKDGTSHTFTDVDGDKLDIDMGDVRTVFTKSEPMLTQEEAEMVIDAIINEVDKNENLGGFSI